MGKNIKFFVEIIIKVNYFAFLCLFCMQLSYICFIYVQLERANCLVSMTLFVCLPENR